jgi:hypothetical protein
MLKRDQHIVAAQRLDLRRELDCSGGSAGGGSDSDSTA